ncbi:serine/threonine-protein kinase [Streptomyces sp. NPDC058691]|uniref:serine/threonine-protein kinase n=1 Tax=Streptomyces sp. NPDC058691 TaxID=3346601 RepID=UPI00364B6235
MRTERVTPVFQPLAPGDPATVAGYRIAARLGEGGMGTVYLSYTPGGRPVAIKVIRPELAGDPEFRRRFQLEVQAAQQVQGLYTAPVIDSDTDGERPWLATAYVAGPSLQAAVGRHGPFPVPAVALTVAGIAEALQAIHGVGIVHRDLKPSNVLLSVDGPRVIDFGIARAADATSLTRSGAIVGTPAFMTPEQASGAPCLPPTDVFALGQVAVYAATGRPAFGEGTPHAALYRIVHAEPQLSDMPGELAELARLCLKKDPSARPTPAEVIDICRQVSPRTELRRPEGWLPPAVAADIGRHTTMPAPPRSPVPRQGPRPGVVVAVIAGLVAACVAALLLYGRTMDRSGDPSGGGKPGRTAASGGGGNSNTPSTPPSTSPSDSEPTSAADPPSKSYKAVDIADGYTVYLSESPPKPQRAKSGPHYEGDFGYYTDGVTQTWGFATPEGNTLVLLTSGQTGSLATCLSATRYTQQIARENAVKGSRICVITAAGHVALATVRGYSPEQADNYYATVDLTVWQDAVTPPED